MIDMNLARVISTSGFPTMTDFTAWTPSLYTKSESEQKNQLKIPSACRGIVEKTYYTGLVSASGIIMALVQLNHGTPFSTSLSMACLKTSKPFVDSSKKLSKPTVQRIRSGRRNCDSDPSLQRLALSCIERTPFK